jgi:hypothetical protein
MGMHEQYMFFELADSIGNTVHFNSVSSGSE